MRRRRSIYEYYLSNALNAHILPMLSARSNLAVCTAPACIVHTCIKFSIITCDWLISFQHALNAHILPMLSVRIWPMHVVWLILFTYESSLVQLTCNDWRHFKYWTGHGRRRPRNSRYERHTKSRWCPSSTPDVSSTQKMMIYKKKLINN